MHSREGVHTDTFFPILLAVECLQGISRGSKMILSSNLWSFTVTAGNPALVRVNSEKIIMRGQDARRVIGDSVDIDITIGIMQWKSNITPATGLY